MKITWCGHSCFKIESPSGSIVIDPYTKGSVPGLTLPPLDADLVLCSHGHPDHSAENAVRLTGKQPDFKVERLCSWHDDEGGKKRGGNIIHIIEADGFRVAHLGDLGHELTDSALKDLGRLDALMIPVGGHFTINAETAKRVADAIGATVTIPMHYRGEGFGYDVISPVSDFAALCDNVEYAESSSIVLTGGDTKKTMILKLVR
jgi:L-ascorbate metabolism protein UlaG (beta-lactamase superfamily)